MNVLKEFPKDYITGVDLIGPDGKPTTPQLVIKAVLKESARDPRTQQEKPCCALSFHGTFKKARVNASSMGLLVKNWGSESDNWIGKTVQLSVMACNLKDKNTGEVKMPVLIRPVLEKKQKPPTAEASLRQKPSPDPNQGSVAKLGERPSREVDDFVGKVSELEQDGDSWRVQTDKGVFFAKEEPIVSALQQAIEKDQTVKLSLYFDSFNLRNIIHEIRVQE